MFNSSESLMREPTSLYGSTGEPEDTETGLKKEGQMKEGGEESRKNETAGGKSYV